LAKIMATKEVSEYLKLHEITICKYAAQGKIPAIRIGGVWRFDKDVIDGLRAFKKRATQMTIVCEEAVKRSLGKNAREDKKDNRIWVVLKRIY